jgi:hypothetical protein
VSGVLAANVDLGLTRKPVSEVEARSPTWSPDGRRFAHGTTDVSVMWADGSSRTRIFTPDPGSSIEGIDWQPIPTARASGYPRPRAANLISVPLVPAYSECTTPDRMHGPPLAFGSCTPVQPSSLTVGTADSNGLPTRSVGEIKLVALRGDPTTPQDEADVRISLTITDVRRRSDLEDYTRSLVTTLKLRQTDRFNGHFGWGGPDAGTIVDGILEEFYAIGTPCTATADPAVGATCAVQTTTDAFSGGALLEGRRTTWEVDQIQVNEHPSGTVFAVEGLFVP